eukprot:scaffold103207_cov66-Phaeocystis_antarctica.AAC.1
MRPCLISEWRSQPARAALGVSTATAQPPRHAHGLAAQRVCTPVLAAHGACAAAERTDDRLLILVPERHVSQAHRIPVADHRVLLLGERCATRGGGT